MSSPRPEPCRSRRRFEFIMGGLPDLDIIHIIDKHRYTTVLLAPALLEKPGSALPGPPDVESIYRGQRVCEI